MNEESGFMQAIITLADDAHLRLVCVDSRDTMPVRWRFFSPLDSHLSGPYNSPSTSAGRVSRVF